MNHKTLVLDERLQIYLQAHSVRESALLSELREETQRLPEGVMQITPEQGNFMAFLAKLIDARKLLEIGVFTGYSSIAVMQGLSAESHMLALDISEAYTRVARRYWESAGLSKRIDLRIGPAMESLAQILSEQDQASSFDFIFIDADKTNYPCYYEAALKLSRIGGIIVIDNLLWSGKVADPSSDDPDTEALRVMTSILRNDERIDFSLISIADGIGLARRKY